MFLNIKKIINFHIFTPKLGIFAYFLLDRYQFFPTSSTDTGRGNSIVVSISVCQAGHPGSSPARSVCFRKVGFYHCVINLFPPVPMTGSKKAIHVLCLCNNACKRSLAICRKSRALCPIAGFCLPL